MCLCWRPNVCLFVLHQVRTSQNFTYDQGSHVMQYGDLDIDKELAGECDMRVCACVCRLFVCVVLCVHSVGAGARGLLGCMHCRSLQHPRRLCSCGRAR